MTNEPHRAAAPPFPQATKGLGLSTKLLLLTLVFVMLAEVCIYFPSIANFRFNWLRDHLMAAQTAALVLDAAQDNMVPKPLEQELLDQVGAMTISLKRGDARHLLAFSDMPPPIDASYDLRPGPSAHSIIEAIETLLAPRERVIRVVGFAPRGGDYIEIIMNEAPLHEAMLNFSVRIMLLSLIISFVTAALVYLSLVWMFVRPMRRLSANMTAFREAPESPANILVPSARRDEIGLVELELEHMQRGLQGTLAQKSHLAALGLAVAKINHDLRNILASAQLFSDRLAVVKDPTVQRLMPKVLSALDRAIALCQDTLAYGKAVEPAPERKRFRLAPLVEEVGAALGLGLRTPIIWQNRVDKGLEVDADPDQLYRVLLNLGRNAVQALSARDAAALDAKPSGRITLSARREGAVVVIEVADSGPGVPEAVRSRLFEPFGASTRRGGSGLGLAIASELVKNHGGDIALAEGTLGATFLVTIPDRPIDLSARRAVRAHG